MKNAFNREGLFIVIEGADGSGKGTQFNLLAERLRDLDYAVEVFDFPRYDQPSSHFVRAYLNGEYGPAKSINPYTASLFYALDRYEAAPQIKNALKSGKIVLSNRYVGSNMAHQGSKFDDEAQQRGFFLWEDGLEYQLLGIPRPSINLYLRVPAEISYKLISQKAERNYTKKVHDEHEADMTHLRKSVRTYDMLTELFPKDFIAIDCIQGGKLLHINEISNLIWDKIKPMLPTPTANTAMSPKSKSATSKQSRVQPKFSTTKADTAGKVELNLRNVSLLAAAIIEDYCPESTRISDFESGFDYHMPENLSDETVSLYTDTMEKIKRNYTKMRSTLGEYTKKNPGKAAIAQSALLPVIPLAAYCDLKVTADEENLHRLLLAVSTNPLPEIRQLATTIENLAKGKGVALSGEIEFQDHENPEILGSTIAKIAQERLPQFLTTTNDEIRLLQASPRNEFDLIVDGLYPHTNLSQNDIIAEMDGWSYQQKKDALDSLLSKYVGGILHNVSYRFDATYDRIALDALQKNNFIYDKRLQLATPRYGYEVAPLIEDAGIEDPFLDCFDESLALFSHLQAAGREEFGGYSTLMGHKLRCQFTITADKLKMAEVSEESLWNVLRRLKEKVSEVHPLIAEHFEIRLKRTRVPSGPSNKQNRKRVQNIKRRQKS